jgi:class 3 adenylate cyclase
MCAGGLPTQNNTHAENAYSAALEILAFVKKTEKNPPEGIYPFKVRIGINTGPVVAGVVGTKKFQYDIWGSTVNIAARMESNSEPGRINISENTYQHLKDNHEFTYRGVIKAKNEQLLKMYYAEVENGEIT